MSKYESMSDFEINKAVALALGHNPEPDEEYRTMSMIGLSTKPNESVMWYEGKTYHSADYCNNPSDAWPIIIENSISIERCYHHDINNKNKHTWEDEWKCVGKLNPKKKSFWDAVYYDKNPLRAAMLVYLDIKDSFNESN